ncbi:MAG: TolC family protein [Heliobacteriaceae bacterium]|jgi:NodT family efflux transporter outer membrane factor (OMF) lipoprotein|nr:TolC family protein [Heliobacteriaceae bacterium]
MRKLIFIILTLILFANTPAFSFRQQDPLDLNEKTGYINTDFIAGFDDPHLMYYIREGIKNNHDVRKVSWQVEEYRQNVRLSLGKELPAVSIGADYTGIHFPKIGGLDLSNNGFVMPLIASYEPDFLLKNRDKTKSAKKYYESSKFEEKAVYISLASDIGSLYINILQYDALINSQEEIVKIKEEQLKRERKKFDYGVVDNAGLNSAKKDFETAKNNLDNLCKSRETAINNFRVLTGVTEDDITRSNFADFDYNKQIPSAVSSDVIFSRPDVLASEANLEKAKIDVRIARKDFLPSFNITGVMTFNTLLPGNFFNWDSTLALILAGATQDIFRGGQKVANLKINKARYEQMFESYKQTDLTALQEVNDALCIIKFDTQTDNNTIEKLKLQKKDFEDYSKKYKQGVVSYPDFLGSKEQLLNMNQSQVQTKTVRLVNYFTLYKALGGQL